jgi:hypothetical protein
MTQNKKRKTYRLQIQLISPQLFPHVIIPPMHPPKRRKQPRPRRDSPVRPLLVRPGLQAAEKPVHAALQLVGVPGDGGVDAGQREAEFLGRIEAAGEGGGVGFEDVFPSIVSVARLGLGLSSRLLLLLLRALLRQKKKHILINNPRQILQRLPGLPPHALRAHTILDGNGPQLAAARAVFEHVDLALVQQLGRVQPEHVRVPRRQVRAQHEGVVLADGGRGARVGLVAVDADDGVGVGFEEGGAVRQAGCVGVVEGEEGGGGEGFEGCAALLTTSTQPTQYWDGDRTLPMVRLYRPSLALNGRSCAGSVPAQSNPCSGSMGGKSSAGSEVRVEDLRACCCPGQLFICLDVWFVWPTIRLSHSQPRASASTTTSRTCGSSCNLAR